VLHHTQLLNRLIRDKKLVPVNPVGGGDITYHDPCYLGRHNKVYDAPRELIGASGAKLTEMPRHADRGLCCGAGGARMWMEEHIGKRVNQERVEEALDTGASKIATGCPFCRVMITDGVDDVSATRDIEKAEVLDVAQLLLGSLDVSSVTLPEKGTAAKEAEERAAKKAAEAPVKAEATAVEAEPEAAQEPKAQATTATETKPVTGLGLAGGAKRPGAKKAAAAPAEAQAKTEAPAPPAKGLGLAAGAKRPGAKKVAAAQPEAKTEAPAEVPQEAAAEAPATPEPEVKGLGIAAGARRPGAKKAPAKPAPNEGEATVTQPPNVDPDKAEPGAKTDTADSDLGLDDKPEPEVKGLGIAPGARRPGAKKAPAAKPAAPQPEPEADGESAPTPEPSGEDDGAAQAPPVKGLGIAKGARPPGKR
jgi:hypothetical protein